MFMFRSQRSHGFLISIIEGGDLTGAIPSWDAWSFLHALHIVSLPTYTIENHVILDCT